MRPGWIAPFVAVGLTLAACSPEDRPRDALPEAPDAPANVSTDVPAGKDSPTERPAAESDVEVDPDPQVGVELPEPPQRVPENASAP